MMYTATERAILAALAALGPVSCEALCTELAPIPEDCVRCALDNLVRVGDVRLTGDSGAPRYTIGGEP